MTASPAPVGWSALGIGTAVVVTNAMGSVADNPNDAGTPGGLHNVSQQIGAPWRRIISTIATSSTTTRSP